MSGEVCNECLDGFGVAGLTGKGQSARIEVMEQGDVSVAAPCCRHADPYSRHVVEVLQCVRCGGVMIENAHIRAGRLRPRAMAFTGISRASAITKASSN